MDGILCNARAPSGQTLDAGGGARTKAVRHFGRPNEQRLFDNLKAPIPNPAVTSHSLVDATQNLASKNSEMHKLALRPLRCFTTALTTSEEAALFPSFINFLTRLLSDPNIEALCDKSPDGAAAATAQSSTRHPEFDFTLDFFQPYDANPQPSSWFVAPLSLKATTPTLSIIATVATPVPYVPRHRLGYRRRAIVMRQIPPPLAFAISRLPSQYRSRSASFCWSSIFKAGGAN
ncbi:hypothetical protein C8R43DRAFT_1132722 [Mycena crocata]|nr:hypothetical protein C8R43DRAFT_1132722 [Mycena crocata]